MTSLSQSPRDRTLDTSQQRRQDGAKQIEGTNRNEICTLNPILDELAKEGRIKITVGKQRDLISLIER